MQTATKLYILAAVVMLAVGGGYSGLYRYACSHPFSPLAQSMLSPEKRATVIVAEMVSKHQTAAGHPSDDVVRAVDALESIGEPAVPALVDGLAVEYYPAQLLAADTLGRMGYPSAIPGLARLLHHHAKGLRREAVQALAQIGRRHGGVVVDPLTTALADASDEIRCCAVEALAGLDDERAVQLLVEALQDRDYCVRCRAAQGLGKMGDPQSVGSLTVALRDGHPDVRSAAAEALGRLGDDRALQEVRSLLDDEREEVRLAAAKAIAETDAAQGGDWLVDLRQAVHARGNRGVGARPDGRRHDARRHE